MLFIDSIIHTLRLLISSCASLHLTSHIMANGDLFDFDGPSIVPISQESNEEIVPGHPLYHHIYPPKMVEFMLYLKKYNIEHPKKKDGFPHMRHKVNKIHLEKFEKMKQQEGWSLLREPEKLIHRNRTKNNNSNRCSTLDECIHRGTIQQKIEKYECIICMQENDTNVCVLECKHAFCTKCFAIHFRHNNKCPLCRKEVCSPPKPPRESLPEQSMNQMIQSEYFNPYPERNDQSMRDYLKCQINAYDSHGNAEAFANMLEKEIMEFGQDIAYKITNWYNSSN